MSKFIEVTETKEKTKVLINTSVIDGVRVNAGKVQFMFNNGEIFTITETYEQVREMLG